MREVQDFWGQTEVESGSNCNNIIINLIIILNINKYVNLAQIKKKTKIVQLKL